MKRNNLFTLLCVVFITLLVLGCSNVTIIQEDTQKIGEQPTNGEDIISYLDAAKYIGQEKIVEGNIVGTFKYNKGNIIFLNFHDPYDDYLTAIIWSEDWDKFPVSPESYYKGKTVRISGEIVDYEGTPEIVVKDPSQIEII